MYSAEQLSCYPAATSVVADMELEHSLTPLSYADQLTKEILYMTLPRTTPRDEPFYNQNNPNTIMREDSVTPKAISNYPSLASIGSTVTETPSNILASKESQHSSLRNTLSLQLPRFDSPLGAHIYQQNLYSASPDSTGEDISESPRFSSSPSFSHSSNVPSTPATPASASPYVTQKFPIVALYPHGESHLTIPNDSLPERRNTSPIPPKPQVAERANNFLPQNNTDTRELSSVLPNVTANATAKTTVAPLSIKPINASNQLVNRLSQTGKPYTNIASERAQRYVISIDSKRRLPSHPVKLQQPDPFPRRTKSNSSTTYSRGKTENDMDREDMVLSSNSIEKRRTSNLPVAGEVLYTQQSAQLQCNTKTTAGLQKRIADVGTSSYISSIFTKSPVGRKPEDKPTKGRATKGRPSSISLSGPFLSSDPSHLMELNSPVRAIASLENKNFIFSSVNENACSKTRTSEPIVFKDFEQSIVKPKGKFISFFFFLVIQKIFPDKLSFFSLDCFFFDFFYFNILLLFFSLSLFFHIISDTNPQILLFLEMYNGDSSTMTDDISDPDSQKRIRTKYNLIRELVKTEQTFTQDMAVVCHIYSKKLLSEPCSNYISARDVQCMFSNVDQVLLLSQKFLTHLWECIPKYILTECDLKPPAAPTSKNMLQDVESSIGQVMIEYIPNMEKTYKTYCSQSQFQLSTFYRVTNQGSPTVDKWLTESRILSRDKTQAWTLDSLLIKPVQRLMKYPLLLKSMLDVTPKSHPDYESLRTALDEMEEAALRINAVEPEIYTFEKSTEEDFPLSPNYIGDYNLVMSRLKDDVKSDQELEILFIQFDRKQRHIKNLIKYFRTHVQQIQKHFDKSYDFAEAWANWSSNGEEELPEEPSYYQKYAMFSLPFTTSSTVCVSTSRLLKSVESEVLQPLKDSLLCYMNTKSVMIVREKCHYSFARYVAHKAKKEKDVHYGLNMDSTALDNADKFLRLHVMLKHELPELFSLTEEIIDGCLKRFLNIQRDWFRVAVDSTANVFGMTLSDIRRFDDFDPIVSSFNNATRQLFSSAPEEHARKPISSVYTNGSATSAEQHSSYASSVSSDSNHEEENLWHLSNNISQASPPTNSILTLQETAYSGVGTGSGSVSKKVKRKSSLLALARSKMSQSSTISIPVPIPHNSMHTSL